jgi:hypothetical protein
MTKRLVLLALLAAARLNADTLGDVKAAVGRLAARQPVHATFASESVVKADGRFATENARRAISLEVAHDASGVSITIPQSLLDKAAREARTKSVDDDHAITEIRGIRSATIVEALDFRDALLRMLDYASVEQEKRLAFRNQPARLLTLKVNVPPKRESGTISIGSVKKEERLSLWIGDDNLPLAAEHTESTTAGFMFLKGTFSGRANYTFARTADRLVVARVETSDSGSGMGQNVAHSGVQTLTLH